MIYSVQNLTSLPVSLDANTIYFISPDSTYVEIIKSDDGLTSEVLLKEQVKHNQLLDSNLTSIFVTPLFKDLDRIDPVVANNVVLVLNSSQDSTGWSGPVIYVYHLGLDMWYHMTSVPSVSEASVYKLGETPEGKLTYNGTLPSTLWNTLMW